MNYELAKELKEAGFPQMDIDENLSGEPRPYRPTLSELIEACGEEFYKLTKQVEGWYAMSMSALKEIGPCPTPEEAVARLWLALNKK